MGRGPSPQNKQGEKGELEKKIMQFDPKVVTLQEAPYLAVEHRIMGGGSGN